MMKPQLASSGSLTGPVNQPSHLSFSILASPTLRQDKKPRLAVQLWDVATCQVQTRLDGLGIGALAFSADGKLLAAGADRQAGGVKVCDLRRGECTALYGRTDGWSLKALAFTADGQKLLAADGYVLKTWDLASKKAETYARCAAELPERRPTLQLGDRPGALIKTGIGQVAIRPDREFVCGSLAVFPEQEGRERAWRKSRRSCELLAGLLPSIFQVFLPRLGCASELPTGQIAQGV